MEEDVRRISGRMKRSEMRTVSGAMPGRVALGTMLFGTGIEEEKAFSLLKAHACMHAGRAPRSIRQEAMLPGFREGPERVK